MESPLKFPINVCLLARKPTYIHVVTPYIQATLQIKDDRIVNNATMFSYVPITLWKVAIKVHAFRKCLFLICRSGCYPV